MNDALLELPEFPPGAKGVLWENWPLDKVLSLSLTLDHIFTRTSLTRSCSLSVPSDLNVSSGLLHIPFRVLPQGKRVEWLRGSEAASQPNPCAQ